VRRKRFRNVTHSEPISIQKFRRILKENHREFPPLIGGVKVV